MKTIFLVVDENIHTGEGDNIQFNTLEEANRYAMDNWEHLVAREQKERHVYVLEITEEEYDKINDGQADYWFTDVEIKNDQVYDSEIIKEVDRFIEDLTVEDLFNSLDTIAHGDYCFKIKVDPLDAEYNVNAKAYDEYDGYEDFIKDALCDLEIDFSENASKDELNNLYWENEDAVDKFTIEQLMDDIIDDLQFQIEENNYNFKI